MLTIENLRVNYGNIRALHGISLTIEEGEIVTIIGANGAGKTSMLRTISGLLRPQSGRILYKPHGDGEAAPIGQVLGQGGQKHAAGI